MVSKSEKRLQRQLEKKIKSDEKKARLTADVIPCQKYVRNLITPELSKVVQSVSPDNYKNTYFQWCSTKSDVVDSWSWGESRQWSQVENSELIEPHMNSHLNNSWGEIESRTYNGKGGLRKLLNKYQPLDSICDEAQQRWSNLDLISQFDELFRLRLGSDRRIWGIRIQHHFYLVWYEREHKICPIA